jgi:hypothetical protein
MLTQFWLQNPKGRDPIEDLCVDKRIALKWSLRKEGGKVWT